MVVGLGATVGIACVKV